MGKASSPKRTAATAVHAPAKSLSENIVNTVIVTLVAVVTSWLTTYYLNASLRQPNALPPLVSTQPSAFTFSKAANDTVSYPNNLKPLEIRFFNDLSERVDVYWVNNEGKEQKHMELEPSYASSLISFKDHLWVFRYHHNQVYIRTAYVHANTVELRPRGHMPFFTDYAQKTGRSWINVYPRNKVRYSMYPGVAVGHKQSMVTKAVHYHKNPITPPPETLEIQIETLSMSPLLFMVHNFLSEDEADHIVEQTKARNILGRSAVGSDNVISTVRTSFSGRLNFTDTDILRTLTQRAFDLMRIPLFFDNATKHSEPIQVIHYSQTQEYRPHHDYFSPLDEYDSTNRLVQAGNNRLATLFLYLNDVEQGGETTFPKVLDTPIDKSCQEGFNVKPKKARTILFYSMLPDGNLDEMSVHGGCPVVEGEKWAANWWFYDPYRYD